MDSILFMVFLYSMTAKMNIIKLKPEEYWKSTAGLCIICGIPLGLEARNAMMREYGHYDDTDDSYDKVQGDDYMKRAESDTLDQETEHHLEENFIRVSLFKYNLLGKMEGCHILDQYTFLKPKDAGQFRKNLQENKPIIEAMGGNLIQDAFKDGAYEKASEYCQRVAAKRIVPGCKMCNATMNRANTHADIVYRCFPSTASLHLAELEDSTTKTGRVVSKGITVKKLIQQVALYFKPLVVADDKIVWKAKDDDEIMIQAAIWRCIANLCMWGRSGTVRFCLVAIFYGAVYLFERLRMADLMLFTDWHMHVFRIFYMSTYRSGTWFGMTQQEAGVIFDTTRKDGLKWCSTVSGRFLDVASKEVDAFFRTNVSTMTISQFKDILQLHVSDEKSLFIYLCKKCGVKEGVLAIMKYFLYNFETPRSLLLLTRAKRFMKEIKAPVSKGLLKIMGPERPLLFPQSIKSASFLRDHDADVE